MRKAPVQKPKAGDIRIIQKFLVFPKTLMLKSNTEYIMTRWLEKAHIEQIFRDGKWRDRYWSNH